MGGTEKGREGGRTQFANIEKSIYNTNTQRQLKASVVNSGAQWTFIVRLFNMLEISPHPIIIS